MKVTGTNPVHLLLRALRERIAGAKEPPVSALNTELEFDNVVSPAVKAVDTYVADEMWSNAVSVGNDQVPVMTGKTRVSISAAAVDSINSMQQHERGRSWERSSIDVAPFFPQQNSKIMDINLEDATPFTPSTADIQEAMENVASALNGQRLHWTMQHQPVEQNISWTSVLSRLGVITVGLMILLWVVSSL